MNPVEALERARARVDEGDWAGALRLLSKSKFPAILKSEASFLAAEAWRGQGFFLRAESLYASALKTGDRLDPPLWIEAALGSAAGLRSLGETVAARSRLASAEKAIRRHRLAACRPALDLEQALVDRAEGRYAGSVASFSRMLRGAERRKDWAECAYLCWAIGGALRFKGELARSKTVFLRSLSLAKRAGDVSGQGYALFGLGGITRIMGDPNASALYYSRAAKIFHGTQDVFGRAYAECGYANALRQLSRWNEAERHYGRAHVLYSAIEDEADLGYVEWGLGQVYLHRGETGRAAARFRRALGMFSRHNEHRGAALSEMSLSQALHALGRTSEAEKFFDAAWKRSRRNGLHAHLEIYT